MDVAAVHEAYQSLLTGAPYPEAANPQEAGAVLLSKATLVIAPAALADQWVSQLQKHVHPGAAVRTCTMSLISDAWPDVEELAWEYDVVVTSFEKLAREWQEHMEGANYFAGRASPLLRVKWQNLVLDEGHVLGKSLKRKLNIQVMGDRLQAEKRFIMTGTPTPTTPNGIAYLKPLFDFLQHPVAARQEWAAVEARLFGAATDEAQKAAAMATVQRALSSCSIRNRKADIRGVPGRHEAVTYLDFTPRQAQVYNRLCSFVRRTNLTSDWYDPNHEESFLFTGVLADSKVDMVTDGMMQDNSQFHEWHARKGDAAKRRNDAMDNLRLACNVACELELRVGHRYELDDLYAYLQRHGAAFVDKRFWRRATQHGGECMRCSQWSFGVGMVVTPCAHLLCLDCAGRSSTRCALCSEPYRMQSKDEKRNENLNPQHDVPIQLIEGQLSYTFTFQPPEDFADLAQSLVSVKLDHIIKRLTELPHGTKSIIFSDLEDTDALGKVRPIVLNMLDHKLQQAQIPFVQLIGRGQSKDSRKALAEAETRFRDPYGTHICLLDKHNSCGWDLSFVQHIFLMEPVLDRSVEEQVISRAHRIGASSEVHIETLLMRGSVEETIYRLSHAEDWGSEVVVGGVPVKLDKTAPKHDLLQVLAFCKLRQVPLEARDVPAWTDPDDAFEAAADKDDGGGARRVRFA